MAIRIRHGDITESKVDVIVNAANSHLSHGAGVAGAISSAAGPGLDRESEELVERDGPVPVGDVAVTGAYDLEARRVIHAVGPRYGMEEGSDSELLASAYRSSHEKALELGARSIAFPVISGGIFGYPMDEATKIAIDTSAPFADRLEITFVAFGVEILSHLEAALESSEASEGPLR